MTWIRFGYEHTCMALHSVEYVHHCSPNKSIPSCSAQMLFQHITTSLKVKALNFQLNNRLYVTVCSLVIQTHKIKCSCIFVNKCMSFRQIEGLHNNKNSWKYFEFCTSCLLSLFINTVMNFNLHSC